MLAEQLLAEVPGGTGRYTGELLAELAECAPPGWTVRSVVARHADLGPATIPGVSGPSVLPLPRRLLAAAWQRGLPWWPGGDSVHAPTPLAPPPRAGRGLVVTVHDTVPWTHPETLTPHGVVWHRRMIGRATARASAVVVPTEAVAADLAKHAAGDSPVRVVGHGVSAALRAPIPEQRRAAVLSKLGLPERFVLAVGTVEPRKGLDVLLAALALPEAPELPLVVVGPAGWGGVELGALAAAHGLAADRLRPLGALPDAELAVVLRAASVLAVPSRAEGFGLPLLEAMAVGVPVVHSAVPALLEVAGGHGVAVPIGEPARLAAGLRGVLEAPARTAERVRAGQRRAAEYTWRGAARAVWEVHRELYEARAG
ncbi:glycosyltransferase involved in cell wall biosynthesis [Tamaricihabitans halophyticus]|uniref:Glycosyltransferase involved in cell wall biosynthesis n=1 Tax=Tamaricihabitans halophyticus TaxID=1262583 RepID=A0A4R2QKH8_9PSEU|nr:glycosyltransferase involved in cell wall biosynthesis [Tamaricihabitans halophyticus]